MNPQRFNVSASAGGNSHSAIFVPDRHQNPFNIGFGCVIGTTAKFTVQHTFQDPLSEAAASLTWFPHETVVAASANVDGNYAYPVGGIRLEVSAATVSADADGSVAIILIQAGRG